MSTKVLFIFYGVCVYLLSFYVSAQTCVSSIKPTAPANRFTNNGDGTVIDQFSGLMWKRCSEGSTINLATNACDGASTGMTWSTALQSAEASTDYGYTDWRLPNIKELQSIVEFSCYEPAIDMLVFPTLPESYWSSTAYFAPGLSAWFVGFDLGGISTNGKDRLSKVRLVRGN